MLTVFNELKLSHYFVFGSSVFRDFAEFCIKSLASCNFSNFRRFRLHAWTWGGHVSAFLQEKNFKHGQVRALQFPTQERQPESPICGTDLKNEVMKAAQERQACAIDSLALAAANLGVLEDPATMIRRHPLNAEVAFRDRYDETDTVGVIDSQ